MKIFLKNKEKFSPNFTVPEFNFGQMQRWEGQERLIYSLEIETKTFVEKFSDTFESFRKDEILENDSYDLPDLIAYEKAGRPALIQLLAENHTLLKIMIKYHEYEILHLIIDSSVISNIFYSINSIDFIQFKEDNILLEGICFEIDRN